jgi:hypothetical protein
MRGVRPGTLRPFPAGPWRCPWIPGSPPPNSATSSGTRRPWRPSRWSASPAWTSSSSSRGSSPSFRSFSTWSRSGRRISGTTTGSSSSRTSSPRASGPVPEPGLDPSEAVAALLYTSGTTGKPKAVELTHALAPGRGRRHGRVHRPERDDRVIGVTALFHVFALGPGILGCVVAGSSLILQAEFEAEEALDLVEALGATVHYGFPPCSHPNSGPSAVPPGISAPSAWDWWPGPPCSRSLRSTWRPSSARGCSWPTP